MKLRNFVFWVFLSVLYVYVYAFVGLLIALDSVTGSAAQRRTIVRESRETLWVWRRFLAEVREEFLAACKLMPPRINVAALVKNRAQTGSGERN